MSTIISPGFEPDNSVWVLGGLAEIGTGFPRHGGSYSLRLRTLLGAGSDARQTGIQVVPGRVTPMVLWVNGDAAVGIPLSIGITDGGDSYLYELTSSLGPGWQAWAFGTIIPSTTSVDFVITAEHPATSGNWYVDDLAFLDQHYPPENGPYKRGQTWHIDDIMGTMMPLEATYRDDEQRLVDSRLGVDEVGRDELLRHYDRPIEILHEEP